MATTSTDLFDLLKSMSPTEKAYFKKYGIKSSGDDIPYSIAHTE
ncbi:MAG: hypothetical protein ACI959_002282 [Limisphaerales bacterium]|jgi:hypothetical protein